MGESNELAVDVEYLYGTMCVVQLAAWQRTLVLDAQELEMRMHVKPLLENADICKVFHNGNHHIPALENSVGIVVRGRSSTRPSAPTSATASRRTGETAASARFARSTWSASSPAYHPALGVGRRGHYPIT